MIKLNLGCGFNILDGWVNCDIKKKKNVLNIDVRKPLPYSDNSVDYVLCEHLFEHLDYKEQIFLLDEIYRVLKVDGVCRLICPSIDFLIKIYNNKNYFIDYIKWWNNHFLENDNEDNEIYKGILSDDKFDESEYVYLFNLFFKKWGHKLVHSEESLTKLLNNYGFKIIKNEPDKSSFDVFNGCEGHSKDIGYNFNHIESLAFDLIKIKKGSY